MSFAVCFPIVMKSEGGYWDDPRSGPTNLGVTIPTLSAWLRRPATTADIKALTVTKVAPLYETLYFNAAHCDRLEPGVDLMVFDEASNEGQGHAIRHLQQALGVVADGNFGADTILALRVAKAPDLINHIHDTNAAYYAALDDASDEKGWQARNDRTRDAALAMAKP